MICYQWNVDATCILTRRELKLVLTDLHRRANRSIYAELNLIIVRLACCCGLRASEIGALRVYDVHSDGPRPHVYVAATPAKGGKPRRVPLWWDRGTLADLSAWKAYRLRQKAAIGDSFLCSVNQHTAGRRLNRHVVRRRFRTACNCLDAERASRITVHHGRHTFVSHALAGGRTLAEIRDAAGHTNALTTSAYLHIAVDDDQPGDLFGD